MRADVVCLTLICEAMPKQQSEMQQHKTFRTYSTTVLTRLHAW